MAYSKFDLPAFANLVSGDVSKLTHLARVSEGAERYEDMCKFMKELVDARLAKKEDLTVEERNLLSVAYKNVIGSRRAAWRTLSNEADGGELVNIYRTQVEQELKATCDEVLSLLKTLIDANESKESELQVFYLKMCGDYNRYLAESCNPGNGPDDPAKMAAKFYEQAYEIAKNSLQPTHPIRLGLALNFSVCYYEIIKDKKQACSLAKSAFDEAISKLDKLEEADYKDSTLIMQLLRDNLTLWTSTDESEDGGVQVEDISDEEN